LTPELNKTFPIETIRGVTKSTQEAKEGEFVLHVKGEADVRFRA